MVYEFNNWKTFTLAASAFLIGRIRDLLESITVKVPEDFRPLQAWTGAGRFGCGLTMAETLQASRFENALCKGLAMTC